MNYSTPICADSSAILNFYAANSNFTGLSNCESLCKKAYGKCKSFLSKSKACEQASVSQDSFFGKEVECDPIEDNSAKKECKQSVNEEAKGTKNAIKAEDSNAKDACAEIRDTCIDDCSAPM